MNKLLSTIALAVCLVVTTGYGQAVIQVMGQTSTPEMCAGFEEENIIEVRLKDNLPLVVSPSTNLEYYWTAHHAEGTWTWRTNYNQRRVLLPFPGQYNIQARVLFITEGNLSPYAAFWSNQIKLSAADCN